MSDLSINNQKVYLNTATRSNLGNDPDPAVGGCTKEENCHPSPCLNEGECQPTWQGYECQCLPDYADTNCQLGVYSLVV